MLAPKRQVREIGRIHFPTISITVIVKELKNWKALKLNSKKYKLEGVVKEKRNKEIFFRFNSKNRVIKKKEKPTKQKRKTQEKQNLKKMLHHLNL